jgi:hypothetical protein
MRKIPSHARIVTQRIISLIQVPLNGWYTVYTTCMKMSTRIHLYLFQRMSRKVNQANSRRPPRSEYWGSHDTKGGIIHKRRLAVKEYNPTLVVIEDEPSRKVGIA